MEKNNLPKHIGIIMDGNRRWARARGLSDLEGHREGADNLGKVVEACDKLGIKTITVYALSTENLSERTKAEISGILKVLKEGIVKRFKDLQKRGVKITILGELSVLPRTFVRLIEKVVNVLKKNERIKLNIALNYGGRKEIVRAVQGLIKDGIKPTQVNEEEINKRLYTNGHSDPDLIIRTGGHVRLSNFLLWQSSYSELYFTKTFWPDFGEKELKKALKEYENRVRNFGK